MAQLVSTIALSHAPGLTGWLDKAPKEEQDSLVNGFSELGRILRDTRPDVIIGVANDHVLNLEFQNTPDFCVGTSDKWEGPAEWFKDWVAVPHYEVAGNKQVADTLVNAAGREGIRFAFRDKLLFDDNWSVPLYYLTPDYDIPLVPIHMNCVVPPLPQPEYCYRVGQTIAKIVRDELPDDMRVAFMATGGLSHDPGGPKYFDVDEKFDRWFLGLLEEGDPEKVLREATIDKMVAAGDGGTSELLAWLVTMGAVGDRPAKTVCYEPAVELRCGMGCVYWDMS